MSGIIGSVGSKSGVIGDLTVSDDLTVSGDLVPSTPLSHRNMIINGAMQVAQRGTTSSVGPNNDNEGVRVHDRWGNALDCTAVTTMSQETDTPSGEGFINS